MSFTRSCPKCLPDQDGLHLLYNVPARDLSTLRLVGTLDPVDANQIAEKLLHRPHPICAHENLPALGYLALSFAAGAVDLPIPLPSALRHRPAMLILPAE